MNPRNARRFLIATVATSLIAMAAAAQSTKPPAAPRAAASADSGPAIATVGSRRIRTRELDSRFEAGLRQYRERTGTEVPMEFQPTVRRQVLENLIRRELLVLEATRRGELATVAEAEAEMKKDPIFNPGGKYDPTRFEAVRTTQPEAFASARLTVREQIGARRLGQKLEAEFSETPQQSRAAAELSLSRFEVRNLSLPFDDFPGTYREPRESDVLAAYRAGGEAFRRPARAVLSVVPFESGPVRLEGNATVPGGERERLRARADSLVAALRAGEPFEQAAARYGGARTGVVVMPDNFPGYWQGDARDVQAVFGGKAGDVVGPVRARAGWMVVRVDDVRPSRIAPIAEVSQEIRARLRSDALAGRDERELRALYTEIRPELRGTAVRVRWAWVDTTSLDVPSPTNADLDRFLKAHLADYSYFDERTATVRTRSLAEVEADVRRRWVSEKRDEQSRQTLESIARAWQRKARDAAAERRASGVREAGPLPPGSPIGEGAAASAVADSLRQRGAVTGLGVGRYQQGRLIFHVLEVVRDHVPTFEQAEPQLRARLDERLAAAEEKAARAAFDRDPKSFEQGKVVHFSRLIVPPPDLLKVPLTREEVERYHRENLDRYSAPEEIIASHILVASTAEAGTQSDNAARTRADELLARLKKGESFHRLAQQFSDDAATRDAGGSLGPVGSAGIPDAVERAAFAAPVGEPVGPVRSEAGYHLLLVTERLPMVAQPLATMWTLVGEEAAARKRDLMNAARADSVFAAARTPQQYKALAQKLGLPIARIELVASDLRRGSSEIRPVLEALLTMKPGEVYRSAFRIQGQGYGIAWVDSIAPPRAPRWDVVRDAAIAQYRSGSSRRALDAKKAELDSMLAQGWSLDSLAGLWGGLGNHVHERGGAGLPRLGGAAVLDSLVIGPGGKAALAPGQSTRGWVEFPGGVARIRFDGRTEPEPSQVLARAESNQRAVVERKLTYFYSDLKRRWPVRILDAKLAQVVLPPPPEPL